MQLLTYHGLSCSQREGYDYEVFKAGEHEFEVERRPGQLAVWLVGHPELPVSVPAPDSSDRLRVTARTAGSSRVRFYTGETTVYIHTGCFSRNGTK